MIRLPNGHSFSIACASGALAFGAGYWWEKYVLIPLGIIDPNLFTIITKTVTRHPRKGNLRWWPPCVWVNIDGSAVNAVGLTNKGIDWLNEQYRDNQFPVCGRPTIVSVMAETTEEAAYMASLMNQWTTIKGIEVNASCPNIASKPPEEKVNHVCDIFYAFARRSRHPVGLKLGYLDPYEEICRRLNGDAAWFDLINTIRWSYLSDEPSPLAYWGYEGGYSGRKLIPFAREVLEKVRKLELATPIISGGGIDSPEEALYRMNHGASAVTVGTMFLTRPWKVNSIARAVINGSAST